LMMKKGKKKINVVADDNVPNEVGDQTPQEQAAAAAVEKIEEKSPILASVIEANCPGAVADEKVENAVTASIDQLTKDKNVYESTEVPVDLDGGKEEP